jgi:hypothetical protein
MFVVIEYQMYMILDDIRLAPVLEHVRSTQVALPAVTFAIVIATDILLRVRSTEVVRKGE